MSNAVKKIKETNPDHLGFGKLMAWKSSDISTSWINLIMLQYLSIYASDALGIDVALVGTILLSSKIVDAITDIIAGFIVDNTKTKLGKGRPYELCIIGMTVCTILLFACPPGWTKFAKCAWIFMMYTLTFSIFATFRTTAMNPYQIRVFSNNPVVLKNCGYDPSKWNGFAFGFGVERLAMLKYVINDIRIFYVNHDIRTLKSFDRREY